MRGLLIFGIFAVGWAQEINTNFTGQLTLPNPKVSLPFLILGLVYPY